VGPEPERSLGIFLVDDHALLRAGLRALIEIQPDMRVVGEAADGIAAVAAVINARPDVVVMDISMPGMNGASATRLIKERMPSIAVLALTAHEESEYVQSLLGAGATGFLLKRAAAADLVQAIRAVANGRIHLDTTMALAPANPVPPPMAAAPAHQILSEREAEVLRLIALGFSMKQIAADLELSPRTLETYKARAMEKLGLSNRADVVRFALQQGWLKSD
jgi:DNA-binding NarL/FixJ family response regulator